MGKAFLNCCLVSLIEQANAFFLVSSLYRLNIKDLSSDYKVSARFTSRCLISNLRATSIWPYFLTFLNSLKSVI